MRFQHNNFRLFTSRETGADSLWLHGNVYLYASSARSHHSINSPSSKTEKNDFTAHLFSLKAHFSRLFSTLLASFFNEEHCVSRVCWRIDDAGSHSQTKSRTDNEILPHKFIDTRENIHQAFVNLKFTYLMREKYHIIDSL